MANPPCRSCGGINDCPGDFCSICLEKVKEVTRERKYYFDYLLGKIRFSIGAVIFLLGFVVIFLPIFTDFLFYYPLFEALSFEHPTNLILGGFLILIGVSVAVGFRGDYDPHLPTTGIDCLDD